VSARRRHRRIGHAAAAVGAIGWVTLGVAGLSPDLPRLCSANGWNLTSQFLAAAQRNAPLAIALTYLAMLAATMAPLLVAPLREVSDRAVASRRAAALGVFAGAYALAWVAAAPLFALTFLWLATAFAPGSPWPLVIPPALVLGWHMSAWRQAALNRCHRRLTSLVLPGSGLAHLAREGLGQGAACVAACGPIMLWAMAQQDWHLAMMGIAALFVWAERRLPPEKPRWGTANLRRTAERLSYSARYAARQHRAMLRHG